MSNRLTPLEKEVLLALADLHRKAETVPAEAITAMFLAEHQAETIRQAMRNLITLGLVVQMDDAPIPDLALNLPDGRDLHANFKIPGDKGMPYSLNARCGPSCVSRYMTAWPEAYKLTSDGIRECRGEDRPDDLITLTVAIQRYSVSRATLKRAIKAGLIRSFRDPNKPSNSEHLISESEVFNRWPARAG